MSRRSAAIAGVILTLAAVALATVVVIVAGSSQQSGRPCQRVMMPAYFYPGSAWTRATTSTPPPSVMILDITRTGAGSRPDPNYQAAIRRAKAAGIAIMGYSDTDYGRRPVAAVLADVSHYKSWYHVRDIFLDRASGRGDQLAYYQRLSDYIHRVSPASTVALNPGTYPSERYMSAADVIVVFEGSYASYLKLRVPGWASKYPASRFADAIYAASGQELASTIARSQRDQAGYVYVTDRTGANPYGSLPSYWPSEDSSISANCVVVPAPATPGRRTG